MRYRRTQTDVRASEIARLTQAPTTRAGHAGVAGTRPAPATATTSEDASEITNCGPY
jgi:hypothetical protein